MKPQKQKQQQKVRNEYSRKSSLNSETAGVCVCTRVYALLDTVD